MKILIKNGTVITSANEYYSDILIKDGKIIQVDCGISEKIAEKVIDAGGLYILPGGVDPHVHMHLPGPSGFSSDDFHSGSRAALYGGTTTILDFVTPARGESLTDALEHRKKEAQNSMIDFSFHVSPVEWRTTTGNEIKECISKGITSFKVYTAYKSTVGLNDTDFSKVLLAVGKADGLVTAHCEMGDEIEVLRNKFIDAGHNGPLYHPLSRPEELEAAAVAKAIELANETGCALYIVHVSAKESLKHIRAAQSRGQKVIAETCPQYLLLEDSKYKGDFNMASPYVISPPLRRKEDNDALWEAIADGTISTIGTDHCPFTQKQKSAGLNDFRKIPNGAGGVEHRLSLLYTYGVLEGRINMKRLVEIFSTQPAKIFSLFPRKGDIAVGSDADLVLWNPGSSGTISAKTHHQNCDINIYEGFPIKGNVEYVIAGGKIIIQNREMINHENHGVFMKRHK